MKKYWMLILLTTVFFCLSSCKSIENENQLVERSIDGVAAYLGYSDGEEIANLNENEEIVGAKAGKYFKDGKVSIYEFEPESSEYKYMETQTDMCVDGFVVLYDYDAFFEMNDYEIEKETQKIQDIQFEPKP